MRFDDEPVPGYPLPILPGHTSPGRFERVLRARGFAVTTELAPPDSADPEDVYRRARVFDGYVDAINATDGSGANCHMSSIAVCALLTRVGYAPIMQISCRDKNRIAIQGDILGGAAMGVCNMLCLTGDGVQAGDHPQAKPVFDLDCVSLLDIARTLRDDHHFQSGRKITYAPRVFFGAAENPSGLPHDWRALRLAKMVAAGAQFIQTQYCYDLALLKGFLDQVEALGLEGKVFILAGVGPLRSAKTAEWMRKNVPGMHVPDALIARLAGAKDQAREGREICIELIQAIREMRGVHGVHIMAYRQEESVAEIVDRSQVLQGRAPWYPGRDEAPPASQRTA
jgi:methylenetetrahydrofolate reductase (NADPH)